VKAMRVHRSEGLRSEDAQEPGPVDPGRSLLTVTDLFRDHQLELVRLARFLVGDLATAEDIVQDVFERMHRRWHRLSEPASGLAYARSAGRRAAVARRYAPRLVSPADLAGPDAGSAADDRDEMAMALRGLPRRQREVLVLRYYLDMDVAEIAGLLRIAPSGVRSNCTRGLAALAGALRKDER
jgi:RNA polymerase sigma factor (sigma-70 family)